MQNPRSQICSFFGNSRCKSKYSLKKQNKRLMGHIAHPKNSFINKHLCAKSYDQDKNVDYERKKSLSPPIWKLIWPLFEKIKNKKKNLCNIHKKMQGCFVLSLNKVGPVVIKKNIFDISLLSSLGQERKFSREQNSLNPIMSCAKVWLKSA